MSTARTPASARFAALSIVALLLAACAGDVGDWKSAQEADTQEAYEAFLARHPDSSFAPQAKERSAQLLEERDWAAATRSDTPEAYQKFIGQHPDGKWTQEARIRVENFNVMAAAAPEIPAETPAVAAAPKAAPAPAPAAAVVAATAPAAAKAASGPGTASGAGASAFRVQLGAFSSVDKAESEWTRARGRFPALQSLEPRITPVQTQAGRLFRLQAGVPDEAAAKGLCDTLKGGGQPCLVVPVK